MARRLPLKPGGRDVGERLLSSKLQILTGTGKRRPSIAVSMLTGRVAEEWSVFEGFHAHPSPLPEGAGVPEAPVVRLVQPARPHMLARTVYLTEAHVRHIDAIIDAWQPETSRHLSRSAVLRRAIEHLRSAVEADPANSLLESESPCPRS